VSSIPLIASSIMSKKLAIGADAILLDVKVGRGAFMQTLPEAEDLARTMVAIGTGAGRRTVAVISEMDRPLGRAVGNALEVVEAIETLRGGGPPDLRVLALHEAASLLVMTGNVPDEDAGMRLAAEMIASGAAFAKFKQVITAQGGDPDALDDPSRLPHAPVVLIVEAPEAGFIADIEPLAIGQAAMRLGAGRERKDDTIDPAVGIVLCATVGDRVERGAPLFTIHARTEAAAEGVRTGTLTAYQFSSDPVAVPPLIKGTITAD
jgi:pyrimidine-nucleoside phosphorylase